MTRKQRNVASSEIHGRPERVLVISPVRNEERLLPGVIASMTAQTIHPVEWVLVDDGSTDRTAEIVRLASRDHPWIRLVQRTDRGHRRLGGGVVDAFYDGLAQARSDYDVLGKLDADMTFEPTYLEDVLARFAADPKLGSASGKVFRPEGDRLVEEFMIDDMTAGQFKLWRRSCFEDIGGLVREVMWDGIDFHRARQSGWRTRSFPDVRMRLIHHRLMGSSDRNVLRGRLRWGRGQYFMGSHPLYVLASSGLRTLERPRLVGGVLIAAGYFGAMLRRAPRYADRVFRSELRSWQLGRLRGLLRRGQVR